MINDTSKEILKITNKALEDKKAENIQIIDISEISVIADAIIIASGSNINQLHAIADEVEEKLSKCGYKHLSYEGYTKAGWILLDYNDVIIHIFDKENREFYDLERLYIDGNKLQIEEV